MAIHQRSNQEITIDGRSKLDRSNLLAPYNWQSVARMATEITCGGGDHSSQRAPEERQSARRPSGNRHATSPVVAFNA